MVSTNNMYVTSCALAQIKLFSKYIIPTVMKNATKSFLQIFFNATYINIHDELDSITVAIYIAVNPLIPVFSPNSNTRYVPTS